MRFSILCTPTDSSDETQLMYSAILLCLFVSKYDINGSRLKYSTMTSNKFKNIDMYTSVSQSERNHPLGGDFHGQGGKNTKGGDWG